MQVFAQDNSTFVTSVFIAEDSGVATFRALQMISASLYFGKFIVSITTGNNSTTFCIHFN